jgi:hypothetical protein
MHRKGGFSGKTGVRAKGPWTTKATALAASQTRWIVSDAASNGAAHDWRAWQAENTNAATSDYPPWYFATPVMPEYSPPAGARAHQIVGRVGEGRRAMSISIARSPVWERDPSGNVRWVPEDVVGGYFPPRWS